MSILITDLTDVQQTLQNTFQQCMHLTNYTDGTGSLLVAAGNSERVGGALYYVTGGDYTVTDPGGLIDGDIYIYLTDTGGGVGDAYLSNTGPIFDSNNGVWYNDGDKAIIYMVKSGTSYNKKARLSDVPNIAFKGALRGEAGTLLVNDDLLVKDKIEANEFVSFDKAQSAETGQGWTEVYRRFRVSYTKTTEAVETAIDVQFNFTGTIRVDGASGIERTSGTGTVNFFIQVVKNTTIEKEVQLDVALPGAGLITIDDNITVTPTDNIKIRLRMTLEPDCSTI